MPKANMLHLHFPATISEEYFHSIVKSDPRIYINENHKLKIFVEKQKIEEGF